MSARGLSVLALAGVAALGLFRTSASSEAAAPPATPAPAVPPPAKPPMPGEVGIPLLEAHGFPTLRGGVDVLVVTLPDPIASHLDWAFDSHLDGVRRAFERAGYLLDRFDLPWEPVAAGKTPDLAREPGALLFRRSDDATDEERPAFWLVYVVGELSTRGIDADALELALADRCRVLDACARPGSGAQRLLRVVGPTFSGTSASLRDRLAALRDAYFPGERVEIVSGAATSPSNLGQLESGGAAPVRFRTTVHDDRSFLGEFEDLLRDFDIDPERVAILQEGTTAYGGSLDDSSHRHLVVPFPMSLGSLRRAASRSASTTTPASTGVALDSKAARTAIDLTEEPTRLETAGATTKLTPASIDLLLDETTRTLAQRDIQAALIFASDVRDKLFLGSELKKRLPDLQLFTFESNVLYLRPEYNEWLRGMVVLSTYPLLLRDARWVPQSPPMPRENLLFANEGAEGTFNATLVQLGRPELAADYTSALGRAPAGCADRPAIWSTAVGATMMLPLSIAPRPRDDGVDVPLAAAADSSAGRVARAGKPISILILSWIALVTVASVWLARMDRRIADTDGRLRGALPSAPPAGGKADLAELEEASLAIHHHMYRALLHFALVSLLLPLFALLFVDGPDASLNSLFALLFLAAGVAASAIVAVRESRSAIDLSARYTPAAIAFAGPQSWRKDAAAAEWAVEIALRVAVALGSVGFVLLTTGLAAQIYLLDGDAEHADLVQLFLHRTVEVDQGLSMLVPLALIGLLAASWARWHLFRLQGLARPEPIHAALGAHGVPTAAVRAALFRVLPQTRSLLLLLAVVPAAAWAWMSFGRTHDGALFQRMDRLPFFDWLLTLGLLGALLGSVWAAVRLISIWSALREVLAQIAAPAATLPFGPLGKRLGLRVSLGLWPTMRGAELEAATTTRWRLYARNEPEDAEEERAGGQALAPFDADFVDGAAAEPEAATVASRLDVLVREFLRRAPEPTADAETAAGDAPKVAAAASARAADDVLGAEIVLYLEGVVRQMRTLCFFLLVSVVLTTLLVHSYPFRPRELMQTASMFVFGGVIACLVWVIGSMNRNTTLSRATGSTPGELTWDRTLFANLAIYAILPIVALVTSQKPELRDTLSDWVKPVVRLLVNA